MRLVFDLEANGFLEDVDKLWCIVAYDLDSQETYVFTDNDRGCKGISEGLKLLQDADTLIGHNIIMYDLPVLDKLFGIKLEGKLIDTFLLSQMLDFNRRLKFSQGRHSLKNWGEYFDVPKPKQEQWTKWEPNMLHRCIEDVRINVLVYRHLLKEQKTVKVPKETMQREMEVASISAQQVKNGWLFNRRLAERHINFLDRELERIANLVEPLLPNVVKCRDTWVTDDECNKLLGTEGVEYEYEIYRSRSRGKKLREPKTKLFTKSGKVHSNTAKWFNISPDDVHLIGGPYCRVEFIPVTMTQTSEIKKFLLKSQGWKPTQWNMKINDAGEKEKTSPKLTEDSFESIEGDIGKDLALHAIYRHRRNTILNMKNDKKGWLGVMRDDSRIECVPFTLGTATGRMSHRKLVNVPGAKSVFGKEMRELFIAPRGDVLVGCDLASAQLRLLASAMEDDDYSETVLTGKESEGTDIHTVNGIRAGLIDPNWGLNSQERSTGRSKSKTFIYAMLFGSGDAKIGSIVGGSAMRGRAFKKRFLNNLPALSTLINKLKRQYKESGKKFIRLQDGKKIQVDSDHKILNYRLQGDEATLTKEWMCVSDKRIKKEGLRCSLLAVMHDEQNFECHPDDADRLAKLLEETATEAGENLGFNCRMDGSSKIGNNWYEIH